MTTYLVHSDEEIYLISIYDKSEIDSVPKSYLKVMVDNLLKGRNK